MYSYYCYHSITKWLNDCKLKKFEIIYPGDQTVASSYRAYSPEVWPEVEFVEQFIKGYQCMIKMPLEQSYTAVIALINSLPVISCKAVRMPA